MKSLVDRIKSWYESYDTCPPWSSVMGFIVRENEKQKEEFKKLIIKEIIIAQKEGQTTSRLTSLYNKL
jgi:hypothetical protein